MNETDFQTLTERIRESCLFFIKGDALFWGALITLYATFKVDPKYLELAIWSYKYLLIMIGGLIGLGLVFEGLLIMIPVSIDTSINLKSAKFLRRFYIFFLILQLSVFSIVIGGTTSYLGYLPIISLKSTTPS